MSGSIGMQILKMLSVLSNVLVESLGGLDNFLLCRVSTGTNGFFATFEMTIRTHNLFLLQLKKQRKKLQIQLLFFIKIGGPQY